jgi:hypothetical protein
MSTEAPGDIPLQPVKRPIICNLYREPAAHWEYDRGTGQARKVLDKEIGYIARGFAPAKAVGGSR